MWLFRCGQHTHTNTHIHTTLSLHFGLISRMRSCGQEEEEGHKGAANTTADWGCHNYRLCSLSKGEIDSKLTWMRCETYERKIAWKMHSRKNYSTHFKEEILYRILYHRLLKQLARKVFLFFLANTGIMKIVFYGHFHILLGNFMYYFLFAKCIAYRERERELAL